MYILYFLLTVIITAADYVTKYFAETRLKGIMTMPLIQNVFHLTYCKNTGGAFSVFSGKPYLLALVSLCVIVLLVGYVVVKKPKSHLLLCGISFISAGGLGNIIDRITKGYVVDFFDFRLINFAIFNVADIFVCVGVALIAIYVLFIQDKTEKNK